MQKFGGHDDRDLIYSIIEIATVMEQKLKQFQSSQDHQLNLKKHERSGARQNASLV